MPRNDKPKFSPLYTPPALKRRKKALAHRLGRDLDGAYRVRGRLDKSKRDRRDQTEMAIVESAHLSLLLGGSSLYISALPEAAE